MDVKLRTSGDKVELSEWQMFRSKFEAALLKVQDWTESEVVETLLRNLPSVWVQQVVKEEAKRAKKVHCVRWSGGDDIGPDRVRQVLQAIVGPIGQVIKMKGCYTGEMQEQQAQRLVQMGTLKVADKIVKLETVPKRMTAYFIFAYVRN